MKAYNPSTSQWEDVYVKALDSFPVGVIVEYPTTDSAKLPTGYMFCDGSAISRTEYSELFSLIGTSFGSGDGSTTFNIPSKKGLVTVGINSSDTDFNAIGKTGGSKELQQHNHLITNKYGNVTTGANWAALSSYDNASAPSTGNVATQYAGTGNSGNLQPYEVSNFIIKVKPTRVLASTVVNAYSGSTENAYSSDYCNKAFGGKVLWTNPNPTSDFASQNITLSSDDYDMYAIIYKNYKTEDYYMNDGATPKGHGKFIMMINGANCPYVYRRTVTFNSATSLTIGNCVVDYGTSSTTNNAQVIPMYVIGYKTGLFN